MPELQPSASYRATGGMVVAVDHLAAGAGVAMLRSGGSAADAAIAANAVLAVTSQQMCGLGGDLFAVVAEPGRPPEALNASGRAGSGADPDRLRRAGHVVMPFRDAIESVTMPGCVDGWLALHRRHGRLPLDVVLADGIRYATEGFPATPNLAERSVEIVGVAGSEDFTVSGPLRPGTIVRRQGVARTLEAIARHGRDGFYGGEFGEGLLAVGGGEFVPADLEIDNAEWVPAISADAWGHRIWTAPPNSSGYLTASSAWIASGLDLGTDHRDPRWAHLLIEASRQAGFDRLDALYDGADGAHLVNPERLESRRALIDPDRAGALGDQYRSGGTMAISVIDRDGLGISFIQSNAAGFGAHIVVPGVRIFLHNRGVGFSLDPGHPGEYRPGRRPAHTLCPTVVTAPDGVLTSILGTMGGDSQPQILLQILAALLVAGVEPGDALAAGRWALANAEPDATGFDTWRHRGAVRVLVEGQSPAGWREGLERLGHDVRVTEPFHRAFGFAQCIVVADDHLVGAADPRPRAGAVAAL